MMNITVTGMEHREIIEFYIYKKTDMKWIQLYILVCKQCKKYSKIYQENVKKIF